MKSLLVASIRFYQQRLRRFHNRTCIYQPSCSEYARLAVQRYGSVRGILYAYRRIRRCNGALYAGGEDLP